MSGVRSCSILRSTRAMNPRTSFGGLLLPFLTVWLTVSPGVSLRLQCYQCEEFRIEDDCSEPQHIANCAANVQDVCQKEVLVNKTGTAYRKACATAASCSIASAAYQLFCVPGRLESVCISCCSGPLCNGPHPLHSGSEARGLSITEFTVIMLGIHLLL